MKLRPRKIIGLAALSVGLASCGIGFCLLLSPAQYQAAVRVRFGHDTGDPDPYFIQTEFEVIKSDIILSNAVERLKLSENWDGRKFAVAEAIHRLRKRTTVHSAGSFSYILEIRVIDAEPKTAARIANAVAEAYCDYRIAIIRRQRIRGLKIMEDEYQKETADIKAQQDHFKVLRKQLKFTNQEPTEATLESNYPAYAQAEHALTNQEANHRTRKAIIAALKSPDYSGPAAASESAIRIVTPAVMPSMPVGPNRSLGAVLLICGLGVSVLGCYLIFAGGTIAKTKP